jgi:putative FmdB family regulatory protein
MPIYEYRCEECGSLSTFLVLKQEGFAPACKKCGNQRLTKLLSRVAVLHSDEQRMERLAEPSRLGGLDENDPRSMARWMKQMGKEMGEDMGEDFDQIVDQAMEEEAKGEGTEPGPAQAGEEPL